MFASCESDTNGKNVDEVSVLEELLFKLLAIKPELHPVEFSLQDIAEVLICELAPVDVCKVAKDCLIPKNGVHNMHSFGVISVVSHIKKRVFILYNV